LLLTGLASSGAWIVGLAVVRYTPPPAIVLASPLALLLASMASLFVRRLPTAVRAAVFLLGLTTSLVLGFLASPARDWLYCLSLVVIASGALVGPAASYGIAALLTVVSGACLWGMPGPQPLLQSLAPIGLLWGAALVSCQSSRSLYATLLWALESQNRAWQTAEEVRTRRAELRRTLDSLRMTHGLLERTVQELEAARAEAEQAREIKAHFVANISHEFRTPLNIIVGFAEMLCTRPEAYEGVSWSPALREDIATIWRNAEHLLKMVDDVLDLAQIEASRLPVLPEPTDLIRLIHETLATGSALLRESHLELRVSLPETLPLFRIDPTRVRQVLLNLVNNAVRFTHQGYIQVGAYLSDGEVTVYVRDTGEGIPPDKLETIFERFEQVESSGRRPHGGLGLGLAISRQLVRLHGGRMWAESEPGKGSTFYFTLPCTEPERAGTAQLMRTHAAASPQGSRPSAVVLCQDPLVVRMLARHVERLDVVGASSVAEARALVGEVHPAAVVAVGDAPSTLDQARALLSELVPLDVAAIVCDYPTERQAGSALGVSDFLVKPVTQRELAAAIARLKPRPRHVLVADDDPDMLRLLCRMVQQEWSDAEILSAATGVDALRLALQAPDVVLLDLFMPGLSGVEVLARLRANPATARIPVIVVTARTPAEELANLRECEVRVLRKRGLAAGEMVRLIESLGVALSPRYAAAPAAR
ncbi:MAG: response regulator, partial [Anaerolineae bacterium]|nr:response regulator [Anaerolineae bacterium]